MIAADRMNEILDAIRRGEKHLPHGLVAHDYLDLALACLDQAGIKGGHMLHAANALIACYQESRE